MRRRVRGTTEPPVMPTMSLLMLVALMRWFLSPRELSYEFVPGTRPGMPDTKTCTEHIFD
jgi:hypothetical protein